MSIHSAYGMTHEVYITLKNDTYIQMYIDMPLDTIISNYPCSEEDAIEYPDDKRTELQKEYITNIIKRLIKDDDIINSIDLLM